MLKNLLINSKKYCIHLVLNMNGVNFILMVSNRSNKSKLADERRDCRLLHGFLGCGGISDGSGEKRI